MAEDKSDSSEAVDVEAAAEAIREVQEAKAILPQQRWGCLGRFTKYVAMLFLLLAAFVYWNFLRTPSLKISKETTYITEPLTADGRCVDYLAAMETELYPPEMKTDDNGYGSLSGRWVMPLSSLGTRRGLPRPTQNSDSIQT